MQETIEQLKDYFHSLNNWQKNRYNESSHILKMGRITALWMGIQDFRINSWINDDRKYQITIYYNEDFHKREIVFRQTYYSFIELRESVSIIISFIRLAENLNYTEIGEKLRELQI